MASDLSKSVKHRLVKARTQLLLDEPFFGFLVQHLPLLEDPSCKTMWTNGVNIGYNPHWVDSITDEQIKGTYSHEVLHVANGHCWRREDRDEEDWNKACDYVINPILKEAGFLLPEHVLIDPRFKGMSAEQVYDAIHQPKPEASGSPKASQGAKGSKGGSNSASNDAGDEKTKDPGKELGSGPKKDSGTNDDGASGPAFGKKEGGGDSNGSGDGTEDRTTLAGEVRDAPKGADTKQLEQQWKQTVEHARKFATMRGKLSGDLKRMVDEALKPTVNWRDVMRQFIHQSWNSMDYSWRLPSSRYVGQELYLPKLVSETLPCLIIATDTSASIWKRLLAAFQAESIEIIDEVKPDETFLVYCDAAVKRVDRFVPGDPVKFFPVGGGGTDFRPVFDWVEKEGLAPACLVYLTDLDGVFPETVPDYPVLWVTPPTDKRPPWGDHLEIRL